MNKTLVTQWFNPQNRNEVSNVYYCSNFDFAVFSTSKLELEKISSVHVFPINENGQILMTKNQRGWDIIGGHVEPEDSKSYFETAKRESFEEGGILIKNFELIGIMIVDNKNNPTALKKYKKHVSYQLFGVTTKFEDVGMPKGTECIDRKWVDSEQFKESHHNWLKEYEIFIQNSLEHKNNNA